MVCRLRIVPCLPYNLPFTPLFERPVEGFAFHELCS